ncbi:MAG: hypothetical protein JNM88_03825 [Chitinophagaceae bacterium]|nr:hypothetical protein [Chitinophagaceae bacterium]
MCKKQNRFPLWTILLFILCISCTSHGQGLPRTWTDDMVLKASYGGGMLDYSAKLEIKKTGSFLETRREGKPKRMELHFTQAQLDSLLTVLRENKFDQIETRPTMIYDKGTTSYLLTWDKGSAGISDGATMAVEEKWRNQFYAIRAFIYSMSGFN